ncbi:hypothetical protein ACLOJK_009849 [Asimina triloba]
METQRKGKRKALTLRLSENSKLRCMEISSYVDASWGADKEEEEDMVSMEEKAQVCLLRRSANSMASNLRSRPQTPLDSS